MSNRSLEDLFDLCIDRLSLGESVERILADFPAEADALRPLLEMGELVRAVQAGRDEIQQAQSSGRAKLGTLLDNMSEKKPKKPKSAWRTWLPVGLTAVLVLALGVGFGGITMSVLTASLPSSNFTTGSSDVAMVEVQLTATSVIEMATEVALGMTVTSTPFPPISATPLPRVTATTNDAMTTIELTATSVIEMATQTVSALNATATTTTTPLPTMTAPSPLGTAPVVVTSVYGMTPNPVIRTPDPMSTFCPGTGSCDITITPVNEVVVQPLRAGQIDDNANFAEFLTYQSNFAEQYGLSNVLWLDVSSRVVINVRTTSNRPVFGARIDIYAMNADTQREELVSTQYTYADGRTQIIPNAGVLGATTTVRLVVTKADVTQEFNYTVNPERTITLVLGGLQ